MRSAVSLNIDNHNIRVADGLYCLNDLHKASGDSAKHFPAYFLRNQQTKDLITEIERYANSHIAVKTIKGGAGEQGTYACRELVCSYAMWISPAFHLKVIRLFLAQTTTQPANKGMFTNLAEGRYLIVSRDGETRIKDIATCSVVDTHVTSKVRRDLQTLCKANLEMANRLAILSGDESQSLLENPLDVQISDGKFKPMPQVQEVLPITNKLPDSEIASMTPSKNIHMLRDKVAIAIQMLKTTYHPDDINRMCKEFGIQHQTARRILSKLYQQSEMLVGKS